MNKNKEKEFKTLKEIFKLYSLKEKLSFILNSLQSVISQLILGGFSWYIFDILFAGKGKGNLIILFLILSSIYFVLIIPLVGYLMESGQSKLKKQFSNVVINRYFSSNPILINKMHSSYIIEILQEDVNKISEFGGWQTVVLIQAIISGVTAIVLVGSISLEILLILFILGLIPVYFDVIYARKNKKLLSDARELYDEKAKYVLNVLDNHIICRLYDIMDKNVTDMITKHNKMATVQEKVNINNNNLSFIHSFIYQGLYRVSILIGGLYLFSLDKLSIGQIALILSVSEGLSFFLSSTGSYIRNIQELIVSKNRFEDFLNRDTLNNYADISNNDKIKSIELKKVDFKYPEAENYIFKDLSYKFIAGQKYLLIGENGLGKSTLFKLIFGLYMPTSGDININGRKVEHFENRKISYVPQEPRIFSGTLLENLITHDRKVSIKEVKNALKIVKLDNLSLDDCFIFENGSNFSKGQLIRIVLCRALLQKPDVLMLDELDANINEEILNDILNNIVQSNPEICIIAISHNKNYNVYKEFINIKLMNKTII